MDLLAQYSGSEDESDDVTMSTAASSSKAAVNCAPEVALNMHETELAAQYVDPSDKQIYHNPTANQMWTPLQGPRNPNTDDGRALGLSKNTLLGYVEAEHYDEAAFDAQYHTFQSLGYTYNPSTLEDAQVAPIVGDLEAARKHQGRTINLTSSRPSAAQKEIRRKRKATEDPGDVDNFQGPWKGLPTDHTGPMEPTEEQKAYAAMLASKKKKPEKKEEEHFESTVWHPKNLAQTDYMGRSWVTCPPELKHAPPDKYYIPKKLVHTWVGHKKAVNAIRWFPNTAHLLLSASMDETVKIWSNQPKQRRCLRTYMGHTHGIRDICFSHDGLKFTTASYDKYIKYWDTETGQCISRHTTNKIPYCVKLHPDPDKNHEALVGQSNKLVVQWDLRANEVVQEYNEHLSAVNTVTFVDDNRRFISTSDDKRVFVWEYGIPVVIKHIAEPEMHSMPFVAVHPNQKWWAGQSMDNQILIYSTRRGFKLNKKKRFRGHHNAGYAAQIDFSPDGEFICSGDGNGYCFFWDWRTSRVYKKLKAHEKACMGVIWHPYESSKVATCGWDGLIKYWD